MRSLRSIALILWAGATGAHAQSPYAGQDLREIKALSAEERAGLLAGKGMGLAKVAELNGYPGPMHVLELADALQLTAEQTTRTEALFGQMKTQAMQVDQQLLEEERVLDRAFSSRSVTKLSLQAALDRIGKLQAELRRVHLNAHLEQTELLTAAQVDAYSRLRGYASDGKSSEHRHEH
jgi:Spy/CpxP family protein refolding chaperone